MGKSKRQLNDSIPIRDDISLGKYTSEILTTAFMTGDIKDVLQLCWQVDLVVDIIDRINDIFKDDDFYIKFIEEDCILSDEQVKRFSNKASVISNEDLCDFLEAHEYYGEGKDDFFNLEYEYGKDHVLIYLPKWFVLIHKRLK